MEAAHFREAGSNQGQKLGCRKRELVVDNYERIRQEVQEAYEQAVLELFLLKVSGQNADKALERRIAAEVQDLQEQLDSLNQTIEELTYELSSIQLSDADLLRPSRTQGVVAEHAQDDDE